MKHFITASFFACLLLFKTTSASPPAWVNYVARRHNYKWGIEVVCKPGAYVGDLRAIFYDGNLEVSVIAPFNIVGPICSGDDLDRHRIQFGNHLIAAVNGTLAVCIASNTLGVIQFVGFGTTGLAAASGSACSGLTPTDVLETPIDFNQPNTFAELGGIGCAYENFQWSVSAVDTFLLFPRPGQFFHCECEPIGSPCNVDEHCCQGACDTVDNACIEAPSISPSASTSPSAIPSYSPSAFPSQAPSFKPSQDPSLRPSGSPSGQPSATPSTRPSSQLSLRPSDVPTARPSGEPSHLPSSSPSDLPSSKPSIRPSDVPSSIPSGAPSLIPSSLPTSGACTERPYAASSSCSKKEDHIAVCLGSKETGCLKSSKKVKGKSSKYESKCVKKSKVEGKQPGDEYDKKKVIVDCGCCDKELLGFEESNPSFCVETVIV